MKKKEKNSFIKSLRKFILRSLISNSVNIIDRELIDVLKELNKTDNDYIQILNLFKKQLDSLKLKLKVDNAIELYKILKKENK